ncbi:single-stranded DNA-binding protein [Nakamurella flavida]|uniref:Single-stranded DNA-binding protein n=1 Tax=Nakamurella flavida TaxID=363630 RepID=A0A938YL88_9ACTN|nr:single-stranded DNA-binding protein [Nakamurella flavida]MBM9477234.1 single-stranded DNA-binding protein [Nakamurella flavida]MDP9780184.1 single-strand DNA-binding protein [Nakamurella flavida]
MKNDGATVTIVGRVAGNPQVAEGGTGDRVTFRVVSTERRYDEATQGWVDGAEYGVSVVCWRSVAAGVLGQVRKGDPLVVIGRLSTRRYEKDGAVEYFTEVRADLVALDIARSGNRFRRSTPEERPAESVDAGPSGAATDATGTHEREVELVGAGEPAF